MERDIRLLVKKIKYSNKNKMKVIWDDYDEKLLITWIVCESYIIKEKLKKYWEYLF